MSKHPGSPSRFFAPALLGAIIGIAPAARAQDATQPCVLKGVSQLPTNTPIYAVDGKPIARFSGAESALALSGFPADAQGRAQVATGTGTGSFRIKGLVDVAKVPVFTGQSVPIVSGHLWIAAQRQVSVIGSAPGRLKVQKVLSYPLQQSFTAWAPCSAFTLTAGTPAGWTSAGDARGYVLKQGTLDLFDDAGPNNTPITTLFRSPEADGVLFFSTERRGAWVHVEHHGDVVVDAWAKLSELKPLPPGETMDQLAMPTAVRNPARLAVQGEPRTVRPTREVPLRAAAKDGDPQIGVIEPGTDTYVLDVMAGWASVMPKALNVIPSENGQFWVKTSDLGI